MIECPCIQCSDWPPGDAPDYFQCARCGWYGTEDEFQNGNDDVCNGCAKEESRVARQTMKLIVPTRGEGGSDVG